MNQKYEFDDSAIEFSKAVLREMNEEESSVDLFSTEGINEESIFADQRNGYCLQINPDINHKNTFIYDPYVKVYDAANFSKAKNCIRVHLKNGMCEHHNDSKGGLPFGEKGWKEFLNYAIHYGKCQNKKYEGLSVFDAVFAVIKETYNLSDNDIKELKFEPLDNYVTSCYWGGKNVKQKR